MKKEDIFTPSGIYHSQQLHHSLLLWFEIITPTIQAGEGSNTMGRGCIDLRPQERQAPAISKLKNLTQDTTNTGLGRE
jgi:hypothetical protein